MNEDKITVRCFVAREIGELLCYWGYHKWEKKEIDALSDAVMERIAEKMCNAYLEQLYWESLYIIYTEMINE